MMYFKGIEIKTDMGKAIELSFPKMKSKYELEFSYIKDMSKNNFKGVFREIKEIKIDTTNVSDRVCIKDMKFISSNLKELGLRVVARLENGAYNIYLQFLEGDRLSKNIKVLIPKSTQSEIHEVFGKGRNEIKQRISNLGNIKVGLFVSNDYNGDKNTLLENSLCFLRSVDNLSKDDMENSLVDEMYFEKILEATILKKYGVKNIFTDMLNDAIKESSYRVNVNSVINEMKNKKENNRILEFTISSLLIA